jgi:aminoglycoside phosphotransferase (APT) family kinase protein
LRVPTADGIVWFKAARPAFSHDARVLAILRPLAPGLLPDVIATTDHGWLLLADAGERAREHPIDWRAMLHAYAELQRGAAAHVDALLTAGAYDNRPERVLERVCALMHYLPAELAAALDARLPHVAERIDRLSASRLPATIDHGDLHDGNVFSSPGRVRIIDWGDSAVAHPLFTLSVAEPDEFAWTLEAWDGHAPRGELEEEAAIVEELRFLLRALNWEHVAALGESEHLVERIRLFVEG